MSRGSGVYGDTNTTEGRRRSTVGVDDTCINKEWWKGWQNRPCRCTCGGGAYNRPRVKERSNAERKESVSGQKEADMSTLSTPRAGRDGWSKER